MSIVTQINLFSEEENLLSEIDYLISETDFCFQNL